MRAATTSCAGPRSTSGRRPPGRLDSHNRWTGRRGLDSDITTTSTPTATGSPDGTTITTDEYGNPSTTPATTPTYNYLGTTQRQTDHLTGLTLMGIRLYTPTTGRFLTQDPIHGGNKSTYGYPTKPLLNTDISGLCNDRTATCVILVLTTSEQYPIGFIAYLATRNESAKFKKTKAGWRAMLKGGDHCSWSPNSGPWFNFKKACDTHDLGYELLRFFKIGGEARRQVDQLFFADTWANCKNRNWIATSLCHDTSRSYFQAVAAFSLKDLYAIPG